MIKKLLAFVALAAMFTATSYGQWQYAGVFPPANPDTVFGQAHGLAVDPDGKVWVANFGAENVVSGTDTIVGVRQIRVYNPDGTTAAFSPVFAITVGGVTDTLYGSNSRGMRADADGNILYADGLGFVYKLDYTNGQGLAKVEYGFSPTAPAVDDNGTVFVGPVLPGNPISVYDSGLNYLYNALDATVGFARTLEVSGDGNTIYWAGFTNGAIYVFNRPDEFSAYDSVGTILDGFHCESIAWNPKSGALWASAGSFNDLPEMGYTPGAWYAYDFANEAIIDSFTWQFVTPGSNGERPRAIDFSPDGDIAYVGVFGTSGLPLVQKFVRSTTPVTVTFNCNMSVQNALGNFDPATGSVYLAGSFTDWATNQIQLTDTDGDLIYSADVPNLVPGERVFFKFRNGDGWENDPNREYVVGANANTYTDYYDRDLGGGIPIAVTFLCDMELEIVSGRFNPAGDTLSVRGSFNGWGSDDIMFPTVSNPNIYEVTATVNALTGDEINYKFAYITPSGTQWEEDPNKTYTFTQEDINNGFAVIERGYNNLTLSTVTAYQSTITFTVDMNGAVNALTVAPFGTINSVVIFGGASPLIWPEGGWPTATTTGVIFLNDGGTDGDITAGDGIWSKNIVFPAYTSLNFEYKYGANWGEEATTTGNDNEATTGVNHSILLPQNIVSARAVDVWADMSPTTLEDIVTEVVELEGPLPNEYTLEQNYPNPFNPATTIRFSLREAGLVTLRVYDLLGQEVATLLNEEKNSGSYEVSFDASRLTSGIYIYTLTANDFSSTRKMMLVK